MLILAMAKDQDFSWVRLETTVYFRICETAEDFRIAQSNAKRFERSILIVSEELVPPDTKKLVNLWSRALEIIVEPVEESLRRGFPPGTLWGVRRGKPLD
jgi:hypothetical protein